MGRVMQSRRGRRPDFPALPTESGVIAAPPDREQVRRAAFQAIFQLDAAPDTRDEELLTSLLEERRDTITLARQIHDFRTDVDSIYGQLVGDESSHSAAVTRALVRLAHYSGKATSDRMRYTAQTWRTALRELQRLDPESGPVPANAPDVLPTEIDQATAIARIAYESREPADKLVRDVGGSKVTEAQTATVRTLMRLAHYVGRTSIVSDLPPVEARRLRRGLFEALLQLDAVPYLTDDVLATSLANERLAALALARGAFERREEADRLMTELAPAWPAHRQPAVDRALLRLGWFEMASGRTPPKVAISEAVGLAKAFGGEKSPSFVNALLGEAMRRLPARAGSGPEAPSVETVARAPAGDEAASTRQTNDDGGSVGRESQED